MTFEFPIPEDFTLETSLETIGPGDVITWPGFPTHFQVERIEERLLNNDPANLATNMMVVFIVRDLRNDNIGAIVCRKGIMPDHPPFDVPERVLVKTGD